jgi:integrase
MRRQRHKVGSVRLDKRRMTWNYLWYEAGTRRSKLIGTKKQFPRPADAWEEVERLGIGKQKQPAAKAVTVKSLVESYRVERIPKRVDTKRSYEVWISHHILPKWGDCEITDLEPRPVELWLKSLTLAPKSKTHIRGLLSVMWDFAAFCDEVPRFERNPMKLVRIEGASKRIQKLKSLTVEEFQKFARHLSEPFRTIALLCCCSAK